MEWKFVVWLFNNPKVQNVFRLIVNMQNSKPPSPFSRAYIKKSKLVVLLVVLLVVYEHQ